MRQIASSGSAKAIWLDRKQLLKKLKDSFPPELGSGSYWPGTRSKWISYCLIIGNPSASSKMT
jgi:hypothetical protein